MLTLLKQEAMKAHKQNRVWIWALLTFLIPVIVLPTFVKEASQPDAYLAYGGASIVISVAAIVLGALTFTQEFTFGTIRPLLSRQYSRLQVFLAKLMTVFLEFIVIEAAAIVGMLVGRGLYIATKGSENTNLDWHSLWVGVGSDIVAAVYTIALVILISNIAKSSGAAIALGIVVSVGNGLLSSLSSILVAFWSPLKWNPFNLYQSVLAYDGSKVADTIVRADYGTDAWVIWVVLLGYIVVMYWLSYFIFNRRSV
ncbi:ABC transporter permease subunit [Leuconostocaceae bacterium ESL0958]|nr:ABC transporter permease subunit [Leuconostocaceae bacterium ESL0958]